MVRTHVRKKAHNLKLSGGMSGVLNLAMVYNALGETDQSLAWLEKGYEQREPKMTFLKVEPKWNNLRNDARFQNLLRRVGLTP